MGREAKMPVSPKSYRVTSLASNRTTLGPYSRNMPRTLQGYLVYKETYTKETERI